MYIICGTHYTPVCRMSTLPHQRCMKICTTAHLYEQFIFIKAENTQLTEEHVIGFFT